MSQIRLATLLAALALASSPALAQGGANTSTGTVGTGATRPGLTTGEGSLHPGPGAPSMGMGHGDHSSMDGQSSMDNGRHRSKMMSSDHMGSRHGMGRSMSGRASGADHSADQLNAQSLSAIQGGQSYSPPGTSSGGAMGGSDSGRMPSGAMGRPGSMNR